IDDGLRAGLLTLEGLAEIASVASILDGIGRDHPGLSPERTKHELVRRLITTLIEDAIAESLRRLDRLAPRSADAIREAGGPVIAFSAAVAASDAEVKALLRNSVYRHPRVLDV